MLCWYDLHEIVHNHNYIINQSVEVVNQIDPKKESLNLKIKVIKSHCLKQYTSKGKNKKAMTKLKKFIHIKNYILKK